MKRTIVVSVTTMALAACSPASPGTTPAPVTVAASASASITPSPTPPAASPSVTTSAPVAPVTSAPPTSAPATSAAASSTPSVEATPPPATTPTAPAPSGVYSTADVQAWVEDPTLAPGKLVFLTFDDGPNTSTSIKVLDLLKAAGVKATFFVVGNEVPSAPEVLKREVAEGHGIALHSLTHDYKKLYPGRSANAARVALEFDETMSAIRAVLGDDFTTTAWRYPGGHMSWKNMDAADAELEARGATWLDWNALTGDAEPKKRRPTSVGAMVSMATQPITQGVPVVVLLAHDSGGKDLTVASMPQIIDAYKAAGYGFGTLS